ncbi:MAG TPA: PAS domain S-box protein [Planctomycetota bacterium]
MSDQQSERQWLEAHEDRFRSVVNNVVEGIVTIDVRGAIQTFNPAAERIFGYKAQEVIGHNVNILMPEPDHAAHDRYLHNYLKTGEKKIIGIGREVQGKRKDGSIFPLYLAVGEFQTKEGRFFTGVLRDITDQKRMENELRERADRLAEVDRQKDDFLAMLAHELRNHLAPLRNGLHIVMAPSVPPAQLKKVREIMQRQVQHLTRHVDDLLDVSRIARKKILLVKERLNLTALVRACADDARSNLETGGVILEVRVPEQPLWVHGDSTRLSQAIGNLLSNASKFTDPGGRVTLELTEMPGGRKARINVRDTGIGMERPMLSRAFENYAQADHTRDRNRGGLGLGLALSKALVELHDGSIRAESEGIGRGSTFIIELPLLTEHKAMEKTTASTPVSPRSRRILLIEDNLDAAESLRLVLEFAGHQVEVAFSGQSGLEIARNVGPEIVLCDIGLPGGMDGYAVARAFKVDPRLKDTPIIALTGYAQEEDQRRASEAGFALHLVKPVDPEQLERTVAQMP